MGTAVVVLRRLRSSPPRMAQVFGSLADALGKPPEPHLARSPAAAMPERDCLTVVGPQRGLFCCSCAFSARRAP